MQAIPKTDAEINAFVDMFMKERDKRFNDVLDNLAERDVVQEYIISKEYFDNAILEGVKFYSSETLDDGNIKVRAKMKDMMIEANPC